MTVIFLRLPRKNSGYVNIAASNRGSWNCNFDDVRLCADIFAAGKSDHESKHLRSAVSWIMSCWVTSTLLATTFFDLFAENFFEIDAPGVFNESISQ